MGLTASVCGGRVKPVDSKGLEATPVETETSLVSVGNPTALRRREDVKASGFTQQKTWKEGDATFHFKLYLHKKPLAGTGDTSRYIQPLSRQRQKSSL